MFTFSGPHCTPLCTHIFKMRSLRLWTYHRFWCFFSCRYKTCVGKCSSCILIVYFCIYKRSLHQKFVNKLRGIYEIFVVYYFFIWDVSETEIIFFKKRTYIWSILIKFCPSYKLYVDPSSLENSSAAVQIKHKGGMNDKNDLKIMHSFFKFLTKDT
jgi:hypothetical protein